MPGESRLWATWQAAHIHVQELQASSIVVLRALTVLAIDGIHRLLHLFDVGSGTSVQGPLHQRLLRTRSSAKGHLQHRVAAQTGIDFHQPVSTRQQADKGIVEFVTWRVLHRLLRNEHRFADRTKHIQVLELHANRCQTGTRGKMTLSWVW